MRIAAMTHSGHVRTNNEDCIGITDWIRTAPMMSPIVIECYVDEARLCVIADGLGGHVGGEVASVLTVRELSTAASGFTGPESVMTVLQGVNKRLYDVMEASPQSTGMGATVVGLAVVGSNVCIFNVGDCRAYVSVGGYLRLLSTDDSVGGAMADSSDRTGLHTHGILQSIGGLKSFRPVDPHLVNRVAEPGERYLLCSDGLTDMLDLNAIEACLTADPKLSVDRLVQAALEAGGLDNISVIIVDMFCNPH
jgi:protein phosphatase